MVVALREGIKKQLISFIQKALFQGMVLEKVHMSISGNISFSSICSESFIGSCRAGVWDCGGRGGILISFQRIHGTVIIIGIRNESRPLCMPNMFMI